MAHEAIVDVHSSDTILVDYDAVVAAAARLHGVAHRTPVLTSRTINERVGASLFFKCENFQRAGAFKFRGAYNALSRLTEAEKRRGVIHIPPGTTPRPSPLQGAFWGCPPRS